MSHVIIIASDNHRRSSDVVDILARRWPWELVSLTELKRLDQDDVSAIVVDIDFSNQKSIDLARDTLNGRFSATPKVFLVGTNSRAITVQAHALGASTTISPPYTLPRVEACIDQLAPACGKQVWKNRPAVERSALVSATAVNESILDAVKHGLPLPKQEISACSDLVTTSLREAGIASWLESVRLHHSYTHRHCLIVSGLAVAFALRYGVSEAEVKRMATCALLHDVGKARIPLSILDKPGALTDDERTAINRHPEFGAEMLCADNQFDSGILEVTRHHHELLDGSGYPDGLAGDSVSSLVRMMTIVDIFSALIDRRSYKQPLSAEKAYGILEGMAGKIDTNILRAFKPVALGEARSITGDLEIQAATA